jgi:hypothetical protein
MRQRLEKYLMPKAQSRLYAIDFMNGDIIIKNDVFRREVTIHKKVVKKKFIVI